MAGNVSGATTTTLTLTGVSQADAAGYTVFLSNATGTRDEHSGELDGD